MSAQKTAKTADKENKNGTMLQCFEWYLPSDSSLWKKIEKDAEHLAESGAIESILIPLDEPLSLFPRVDVKEDDERFAIAGNLLEQHNFLTDISQMKTGTKVRIYGNNRFLAVGTCQDTQTVKPNKVLVRAENG